MKKDFDEWNKKKKAINTSSDAPFCHEREVWWCSLGVNVGFEQDGTTEDFGRPILVLKVFSKNTCLIVPLTTSQKKHKYRISIGLINGKNAYAILSQIKIIDTKRLENKVGMIKKIVFAEIRKSVKDLL